MELTLKPHSDNTERELSVERKTRDVTMTSTEFNKFDFQVI